MCKYIYYTVILPLPKCIYYKATIAMVAVPCNRVEENYLASTDKLTLDKTILVKKYSY
jgi:hypothetical protein